MVYVISAPIDGLEYIYDVGTHQNYKQMVFIELSNSK